MKIYIHKPFKAFNLVNVEDQVKIGDLVKTYASELVSSNTPEVTVNVCLEDTEEALPHNKALHELGIKEKSHLHISHCKKVDVVVLYAGREYSASFPSPNTLEKVFRKATKYFDVPEEDEASLYFFMKASGDDKVELHHHIGALVSNGTCSIQLYLSREKGIQG